MRGVTGQWGLEVLADGRDLGLDTSNVASYHSISNIHQFLPTISIEFRDDSGRELDTLLQDGSKLTVSHGVPDVHMYQNVPFIVSGMPDIKPTGGYTTIGLSGVYDAVAWQRKVTDKHFPKMSSADAIGQLAAAAGLSIDADQTDDLMTWLPTSSTIAQYAKHIAERSFSGLGSAMLLAVTDNGKVRYKDINKLINSGPAKTLASRGGQNAVKVLSWTAEPKSKVGNHTYGYGATSIGMNEDGSVFESNRVEMTLMSAFTGASKLIQDTIGDLGGRITSLPPLAGNTHKNWNQALHQNKRIKSSYSFDVETLTDIPSQLELLDVVRLELDNPSTQAEAKAMTGNYVVTAITKFLYKNRYLEKIVVTAQGAGGV